MHEMAIAEEILDVVLGVANEEAVHRVRVRAGQLQRIVPSSLQFCFEVAALGTPAEHAAVECEEVACRVRCRRCTVETTTGMVLQCHACGTFDVQVVAGHEVLVEAIELASGWRRRPASPPGLGQPVSG